MDVIRAIRKCAAIKQLIYVSCNQDSLVQNAAALCRAASKHLGGENFVPVRSEAVDMFPQTDQAELVMLFQRESVYQANKAAAAAAAATTAEAATATAATTASAEPATATETATTAPATTTPGTSEEQPHTASSNTTASSTEATLSTPEANADQ